MSTIQKSLPIRSNKTKRIRFLFLDYLISLIFNEDKFNKFAFKFALFQIRKERKKTGRLKKSFEKRTISRKLPHRLNPPRSK